MKKWLLSTLLVAIGVISSYAHSVPVISAQSCGFVVSILDDSGPGSLRAAIACADANPGPDTITFSVGGPIPLQTPLRVQSPGTTIDGGSGSPITLDGTLITSTQQNSNVIEINHDTSITPISATIKNLRILNPNGNGIFVGSSGVNPPRTVGSLELDGIQATTLGTGLMIMSPNVSNVSVLNSTLNANTGQITKGILGGVYICMSTSMGFCDMPIAVSNLTIRNSTLSGRPGMGVVAGGAGPSTITDVTVISSTLTSPPSAIGLLLEGGYLPTQLTVQGVTLTNNTIQGGIGVCIGGSFTDSAIVQNLSIVDNTITGLQGAGIRLRGQTLGSVSIIQNKAIQAQTLPSGYTAAVYVDGVNNNMITIGNNPITGLAPSDGVFITGTVNSNIEVIGNTITAGGQSGVRIREVSSGSANSILGNTIFSSPSGIAIRANNWSIRSNTLRDNTVSGVSILSGWGNRISQNSIHSTSGLGIDLLGNGATPNDPGDIDLGPNKFQNYPALTSVVRGAGSTTIQGVLNSTANTQFVLEFFASPTGSISQGKTYLGSTTVTTDSNGNSSFTVTLGATDPSDVVSATATDPGNNTSEFTPPNTPAGNNISVELGSSGSVTFGTVSSVGTTLESVSSTGSTLPTGFALGDPPTYYDISTTAAYAGQVKVCLKYDPAKFSALYPPRIMHYQNGAWADVTISEDSANSLVCGQVSSLSPFVVAKKDTTLPTINIASPISASYFLGQPVPANYSCADGGSGVASCVGTVANGANLNTGSIGAQTFKVDAKDKAANTFAASVSYNVIYNFSGFFQPVDNPPALNQVKAGSAIPVKFSLAGNQGLNIFWAGFPATQPIACDGSAQVQDIEQTVIAGNSSLSYDPGNQQYNYVWKTDSAWEGTCRRLIVKLIDGTEHLANFKFK